MTYNYKLSVGVEMVNVKRFLDDIQQLRMDLRMLAEEAQQMGLRMIDLGRAAAGFMGLVTAFRLLRTAVNEATDVTIFSQNVHLFEKNLLHFRNTLNSVRSFYRGYPVPMDAALEQGGLLLAQGIKPGDLSDVLLAATSMSAFSNDTRAFQFIARALGQIKGKGRLMGQELRQMEEWGVPIRPILAAQLAQDKGGTAADWEKRLLSGKTSLNEKEFFDSLKRAFTGPQFRQMLSERGMLPRFQTIILLNNLRDVLADVGKKLLPIIGIFGQLAIWASQLFGFLNRMSGGWLATILLIKLVIGSVNLLVGVWMKARFWVYQLVGSFLTLNASLQMLTKSALKASAASNNQAALSFKQALAQVKAQQAAFLQGIAGATFVAILRNKITAAIASGWTKFSGIPFIAPLIKGLGAAGNTLKGTLGKAAGTALGGFATKMMAKIGLAGASLPVPGLDLLMILNLIGDAVEAIGEFAIPAQGNWRYLRMTFGILADLLRPHRWLAMLFTPKGWWNDQLQWAGFGEGKESEIAENTARSADSLEAIENAMLLGNAGDRAKYSVDRWKSDARFARNLAGGLF